jgi:hypothetical protein
MPPRWSCFSLKLHDSKGFLHAWLRAKGLEPPLQDETNALSLLNSYRNGVIHAAD